MESKDLEKFAVVIYELAEEFGGTVSENGVKVKFKSLHEYSILEIQEAGVWILKNREERFPPVPTIVEFIDTMRYLENRRIYEIEHKEELEKRKLIGRTHENN